MNVKNFLVSGTVGGIVNFLLGWLLWGILFKDFFPPTDENTMNMLFIFLGCMTFGYFISYIFLQWAQISTLVSGAKGGAIIALFLGLYNSFFYHSNTQNPPVQMMIVDISLTVICGIVVGAAIAMVIGKMKD
jgi:hypothetical protein